MSLKRKRPLKLKGHNRLSRLYQVRRNLRIKRLKRQQREIMDRNALYFVVQKND